MLRGRPLGHAGWLVEVDGLRIVFDPLLGPTHHGGVFEVVPRRTIDPRGLAADVVVISHRHADHFDVASLVTLARADADSVVVSPDSFVLEIAREAGFRSTKRLPPRSRLSLDRGALLTTDSIANADPIDAAIECGFVVADGRGASLWNQVDTALGDAATVRATVDEARAAAFAQTERLGLAIVPWCPLRELEAVTAGDARFPYATYFGLLDRAAAIDARALILGSAGARHVAPNDWLNRWVYPVAEAQAARDLAARAPRSAVHRPRLDRAWSIDAEHVVAVDDRPAWLELDREPELDDRRFSPHELPPLIDDGATDAARRDRLDAFVQGPLARALARAPSYFEARLRLEIVHPSGIDVYRLAPTRGQCAVTRGEGDDDHMLCNRIAASALDEVLEGRLAWGDALLAGKLRLHARAYRVDAHGGSLVPLPPVFLYAAIGYVESFERACRHALARALVR